MNSGVYDAFARADANALDRCRPDTSDVMVLLSCF